MRLAFPLFAICLLLGCKDPNAGVEPAKVEELTEAAVAPGSVDGAAETLAITPKNSKIGFIGAKLTQQHKGGFGDFEGKVVLAEPFSESRVEVTIQTASLFTDEEKLTKHLKSPDFFDVAQFPTASFKSTQLKATALGYSITGDLTLHGQTKRLTFPASLTVEDEALVARAGFLINRQDFGISYPGMPDDLIRDNVRIELDLNLPRKGS